MNAWQVWTALLRLASQHAALPLKPERSCFVDHSLRCLCTLINHRLLSRRMLRMAVGSLTTCSLFASAPALPPTEDVSQPPTMFVWGAVRLASALLDLAAGGEVERAESASQPGHVRPTL